MKKKVTVALSGGVDSAVSALLLKKQGYEVSTVFMKNWSGDDFGIQADCPWEEDQKSAQEVAEYLNVPFRSYNFEKEYRQKVVEYFFSEYKQGRTPNPDVMCNKEIKFKLFMQKAFDEGAELIATGHYCRVIKNDAGYHLLKGLDTKKSQEYFLYNLKQEQLSKIIFPIGHLIKAEVRKIALENNLPNAKRPDSQGICFIGEIDVLKFLMKNIPEKKGDIVDIDNNQVIGKHKGIYYYTIGQRGLGIGGRKKPMYVCKKSVKDNILYVCEGDNHPALRKSLIELENIHFINDYKLEDISASIRYRQLPQECRIIQDQSGIFVKFKEEQLAVASGQSVVFYKDETCIGGGIIK